MPLERAVNGSVAASTPVSCGGYDTAVIQVSGLSGGDTIAAQGSVTGATFVTLSGVNLNTNASAASITADGIYAFQAPELFQYTKTGSASTPTVSLLLKA